MRVLFYTAASIAAIIANISNAVRLEDTQLSQIEAFQGVNMQQGIMNNIAAAAPMQEKTMPGTPDNKNVTYRAKIP
jgi:hypothetical protein